MISHANYNGRTRHEETHIRGRYTTSMAKMARVSFEGA